ncbi:multidrug effflux MFS transporter [Aquincola sp. S2]|uniref:Bcr/CflA family efflux transporter n=1 Tax=Pseudaquabacterium terrae TaxID=2732868 RepID=A0ABX2EIE2_9BURK|nr:multidrug effflux MFS transporter [Aquabacterium terrae]NRF68384.1 multidrug effflux MFS transporter [Aquabacterium terrae]
MSDRTVRAPLSPLAAAWTLALLLGLQPLTTDLVLPALPAMGSDLQAPVAPVQLTMSALILAFGLAQLVWGPVADRFGRRPVLLAGLGLYTLASAGAALGGDITQVIGWRIVQGAALSVPVVCARAMLRDLYQPHEGALVMARALSGLGVIAIASPLSGGLLVAASGWRATLVAMGVIGLLLWALIAWRLPETLRSRDPAATRLGPLLAQAGRILGHPTFRAWSLLVACTYAGLFVFLAGSGFILIRVLGLAPLQAGLVMCTTSLAYITGTFFCRRWLPRHGLVGTVLRGSGFSIASALGMAVLASTDHRAVWAVMLPTWLYALGHGVHQPCGQAGAVGPFPRSAGLAAALAGCVLALAAFGIGLWLGHALDGTLRPLAIGIGSGAAGAVLVVWTLVRRHGDPARVAV